MLASDPVLASQQIVDKSEIIDFMQNYPNKYSLWPVTISPQIKANFDYFIKMLSTIAEKVINYFLSFNAESFSVATGMPHLLHDLYRSKCQSLLSQRLIRYDVVFSTNILKLIEINCGSNIGGWQLDWLKPQFDAILAGQQQTRIFSLKSQNILKDMFRKLMDNIATLPEVDSSANILLYIGDEEYINSDIMKFIKSLFSEIAEKCSCQLKVASFNNWDELTFSADGETIHNHNRVDALICLSSQEIPNEVNIRLLRSYIVDKLVFPDSPLHRIIGNKSLIALIYQALDLHILTTKERRFIIEHIPASYCMDQPQVQYQNKSMLLQELLIKHQEDFVIKKALSFQGIDVFIGRDMDPLQWRSLIDKSATSQGWIAQQFCEPDNSRVCDPDHGVIDASLIWGIFDLGREYRGAFVRASTSSNIINSHAGAIEYAVREELPTKKKHLLVI